MQKNPIMGSLITNAIDVSTKGQVVILRTNSGGNSSILEVIDSGPGVQKGKLSSLLSKKGPERTRWGSRLRAR